MHRIVSLSATELQIVTLYDAKGCAVLFGKNNTSATPFPRPEPIISKVEHLSTIPPSVPDCPRRHSEAGF